MCEEDAVDPPMRRDTNVIDQDIDRVPKKFETRDERDLQCALGKLLAELARMIEYDLARPSVNERASVEILNATDPDQVGGRHALRANELRLYCRRSALDGWVPPQMPVIAVPLDRFSTSFTDGVLERRHR